MDLRLIEVFFPEKCASEVSKLLEDQPLVDMWHLQTAHSHSQALVKVLLSAQDAEAVIDRLNTHFSEEEHFRIVLLAVEASVPRLQESEIADPADSPEKALKPQKSRINRQELYEDVSQQVELTWNHVLMVVLSTIIAAIGLSRSNSTIITGAMVIAPLLGPNMALSLATTLGDSALAIRAVRLGGVGIAIALGLSILVGWSFPVNPDIPEIAFRTQVNGSDLLLAFASGIAGALSFTSGTTSAIVGVMVAVALLPPLVAFGMLLGSGEVPTAIGAMLLLLTNLICLNFASVLTFSVQNIRPGQWWEAVQARKTTNTAFGFWLVLLGLLMCSILLWRKAY